jgi:hypothetical protein
VQAALWAALTLIAALDPGVRPWTAGPVALGAAGLAALLGARWPALGAMVLVLGATPLWCAAILGAGVSGAALLLGAAGLLAFGRGPLPPALRVVVLIALSVEALRAHLAGPSLPALGDLALPWWLVGLGLVGCLSGALPGRLPVAGLLLAGLITLGRSALLLEAGAHDTRSVESLVQAELFEYVALPEAPGLALFALSRRPTDHALALALLPEVGLDRALSAGWDPLRAHLSPELRREIARWLDQKGRGGAAIRLLRRGRADPTVAWTAVLYARQQGRADLEAGPGERLQAPEGTASLPGHVALSILMDRNGEHGLDFDARAPLARLVLTLEGESWRGDPALSLRVDQGPIQTAIAPAGRSELTLEGTLRAGPHRIVVRFLNDARGEGGDRNLRLIGISDEARSEPAAN